MRAVELIIAKEGFREYPYDDATGQRIRRGLIVQGTPTFGHGLTYITEDESRWIVQRRAVEIRRKAYEYAGQAAWRTMGSARKAVFSRAEKNCSAIWSRAKSGRIHSISTPSSRPRVKA